MTEPRPPSSFVRINSHEKAKVDLTPLFFCGARRPVKEELPSVLNNRSNVFDDDEFDVFRRDQVDMSRIWKGRR